MVKFSKIMFFMLLCCLLPSVSNAKIEKVEKYQWTGYSGGGCSTEKKACETQDGFYDNGCPKYKIQKDTSMTHKIKTCIGGKAGSSKLVCDGKGRDQVTLLNSCDCPDGMVDITRQYEKSRGLFNTLYPTAGASGFFKSISYSELSADTYVSKTKYCANIKKLTCGYGNKTLATIKNDLNIKSNTTDNITDLDGDGATEDSYNSYIFYNDSPKFKISTIGFTFNGNVCLQDSSKIEAICNGTTADCNKINDKPYPLINTSSSLGCGDFGSKMMFVMKLWNDQRQIIHYCGGCDTSDDDVNEYVIIADNSCNSGHTSLGAPYYAGYIGSQWKIHGCKKCSNQCSGHPSVSSGLYVYANQPTERDKYTINQGYRDGTLDGIGNYCPITCPDGTDVAFATTSTAITATTTGVTSAAFDMCGDYSSYAETHRENNTVNANLLYNIDKFLYLNGATLVCANAVSCDFNRNYTETCSGGQLSDDNWCSFWATKALDRTQYSQACGYACAGDGQRGVGAKDTRDLYKSCECSTEGYTYQCNENGQSPSGTACTADPDTTALYQGCNCSAAYKYKCDGDGESGIGTPCTIQPSGEKRWKSCYAPAVVEPEVSEGEITNYCPIGDNIRDTVLCHINALQEASESGSATVKDYYGDKSEFIPVNQTIQLVPLVIKSKEHYNSVYKMLEKFTDGQPALMYSDGKNWSEDESREYKESLKYAINPYVFSYKFIEQGIHWIKTVNGDSSQFKEFSEIMSNTKDNLKSHDDVINIADNYSYIVNLFNEKEGAVMTYIHPRLGGIFPGDEFFNAAEEGIGYYYIPKLEESLENLQKALDKLELKVDDLKPDDEETMFWYYLVNGYLQVEEQYYPK